MAAGLFYGSSHNQYVANYGNHRLFSEGTDPFVTQLPRNQTIIRIVSTLALTIFAAFVAMILQASFFCWPVIVLGASLAGWTAYAHLLSEDPLIEVFHQIVGGKERFDQLPEIGLYQDRGEKIYSAIQRLQWENLNHSISKTTTLDGRKVIIVKGLSRQPEIGDAQTKKIFAFIEKVGPEDIPRKNDTLEKVCFVLSVVLLPLQGNRFGGVRWGHASSHRNDQGIDTYDSRNTEIYASIDSETANEFFAQYAPRH